MWMSLARRCSAVKIVVSTRRMIGLMSWPAVAVNLSMEMVSSFPASSSRITSSVNPSLASSSTRLDCSVFLQNVGDLLQRRNFGEDTLAEQQADLVDHHQLAGIGDRDGQAPVVRFIQGHEVIAEHQVHGDLFEQIVVQLEIAQIDEFATVAPRNIPRAFQFVGNCRRFRHQLAAVYAAYQYCLLIRHSHSSLQSLTQRRARSCRSNARSLPR